MFQFLNAKKDFLIECDLETNERNAELYWMIIKHLPTFVSFQIHSGAAQVHPSEENRDENFPVPAPQVHLRRPQLHGHKKSSAYTR